MYIYEIKWGKKSVAVRFGTVYEKTVVHLFDSSQHLCVQVIHCNYSPPFDVTLHNKETINFAFVLSAMSLSNFHISSKLKM